MNKDEIKKIMQDDDKTWFTISNLSERTQMKESEIQKLITNSSEFAQSSSRSPDGENLFSTRDDFQKSGNIVNRLLGAFKNRID